MWDRFFGLRNPEKDIERIWVDLNATPIQNMEFVYRLAQDSAASATTVTLNRAIPTFGANQLYLIIDPATSDCEIRKVTAISDATYTVAALTYAHSEDDRVLWSTSPLFDVTYYGAKGDGSTDDTTALARAAADANTLGGGVVWLPRGTYLNGTELGLGQNVGLWGQGYESVIEGTAAINVVAIRNVSGSGNRQGTLRDFYIDCNDTATRGLYCELSVRRHYQNIQVRDATGQGIEFDNCQNNTLITIMTTGCATALKLDENSSGNRIAGGNFTDYSSYGLRIDTSVLGSPSRNTFIECLWEQATSATHALNLASGVSNTFIECNFGRCTNDSVAISSSSLSNEFFKCLFDGDRSVHLPVVDCDAEFNRFTDNDFQNAGAAFTLGDVVFNNSGDPIFMRGNRWRNGTLTNTGSIIAS